MIIKTTSAVNLPTYDKKILFKLKDKNGLYYGYKNAYENLGEYDTSINELIKISDNEKLYNLLYGHFSHIVIAGFIHSGRYTIDDINEFYEICKKLNIIIYEGTDEKDNKTLYKLN